jgi:ribosomal subunit interface protein
MDTDDEHINVSYSYIYSSRLFCINYKKGARMNVIVQAKSMPTTHALRQFVRDQAAKVARFSGRVSPITVYLEQASRRKTNDPTATVVKYHIKLPGKDIVVRRRAVDMYDAIVAATDRAIRHVRKFKEKRLTLQRDPQ